MMICAASPDGSTLAIFQPNDNNKKKNIKNNRLIVKVHSKSKDDDEISFRCTLFYTPSSEQKTNKKSDDLFSSSIKELTLLSLQFVVSKRILCGHVVSVIEEEKKKFEEMIVWDVERGVLCARTPANEFSSSSSSLRQLHSLITPSQDSTADAAASTTSLMYALISRESSHGKDDDDDDTAAAASSAEERKLGVWVYNLKSTTSSSSIRLKPQRKIKGVGSFTPSSSSSSSSWPIIGISVSQPKNDNNSNKNSVIAAVLSPSRITIVNTQSGHRFHKIKINKLSISHPLLHSFYTSKNFFFHLGSIPIMLLPTSSSSSSSNDQISILNVPHGTILGQISFPKTTTDAQTLAFPPIPTILPSSSSDDNDDSIECVLLLQWGDEKTLSLHHIQCDTTTERSGGGNDDDDDLNSKEQQRDKKKHRKKRKRSNSEDTTTTTTTTVEKTLLQSCSISTLMILQCPPPSSSDSDDENHISIPLASFHPFHSKEILSILLMSRITPTTTTSSSSSSSFKQNIYSLEIPYRNNSNNTFLRTNEEEPLILLPPKKEMMDVDMTTTTTSSSSPHVLGPGDMGGEAMNISMLHSTTHKDDNDDKNNNTEDDKDEDDDFVLMNEDDKQGPTIAETLATMSSNFLQDESSSDDDDEEDKNNDNSTTLKETSKQQQQPVTSDSLLSLLYQAIQSNDDSKLEIVFQVSDPSVIANTIHSLLEMTFSSTTPNSNNDDDDSMRKRMVVVTLISKIATRIAKRSVRTKELSPWMTMLLTKLMQYQYNNNNDDDEQQQKLIEEVAKQMNPLRNLLMERSESLSSLLHLEGRLTLLSENK